MDQTSFLIKLQEVIGPKGLSLIQKSLVKAGLSDDGLVALDILPRAVLSWLFKTLSEKAEFNGKVPGTDITLSIKKNENGFVGKMGVQNQELVINHASNDLGAMLISLAFDVNLFKSNSDFSQIQSIINTLINDFHFSNQKHTFLVKNDSAVCPDCGETIRLREIGSKVCICYSVLNSKNLHVMKNENGGFKISFGKNWDKDNIKLFLRALENKRAR